MSIKSNMQGLVNINLNQQFLYAGRRYKWLLQKGTQDMVLGVLINGMWIECNQFILYDNMTSPIVVQNIPADAEMYFYLERGAYASAAEWKVRTKVFIHDEADHFHLISNNYYFTENEALQDTKEVKETLQKVWAQWYGTEAVDYD